MIVRPVEADSPGVAELIAALDAELAQGGYTDDESFGYSLEQLRTSQVYLLGGFDDDRLVGVGGVEIAGRIAELKRFYVSPGHRGSGAADSLARALLSYVGTRGVDVVRLETGDQQHAAIAFYRRHGFAEIPRFGPYVDSATSVCMERRLTHP